MKVKDVKELLNQFPDDMDFIITHDDGEEGDYCYEIEFTLTQESVNHCNYSTTSVNDIDYYSFEDDICLIKDMIEGKWEYIELPMNKKEVVVLEF